MAKKNTKQSTKQGGLIVRRAFSYNGRQYAQGDTIELVGGPHDGKLLEQRLVVPAPAADFVAWPTKEQLPEEAAQRVEQLESDKAEAEKERDEWLALLEQRQAELEQATADGRVHAKADPAAVVEARALAAVLQEIASHIETEVRRCENSARVLAGEINQEYQAVANQRRRLHELEQQAAVTEAALAATAAALA